MAPGQGLGFPPRDWFGALRAEHRFVPLVRAFALPSRAPRSAPKVGRHPARPHSPAMEIVVALLIAGGWNDFVFLFVAGRPRCGVFGCLAGASLRLASAGPCGPAFAFGLLWREG